jgi:VRR-NUC domain
MMHSVPISAPRPTLLAASEEYIQRALVQLLERAVTPGVAWTHIPSGELRHRAVAGKLKGMGVKAGWPDLMFWHQGRTYGLELKTPTGRLSASQAAVHEGLTAAGAIVAVAYGLDAAIAQLKTWELIR